MDIELTLSHGAIHSGIVYSIDEISPRLKGLASTKGVPLPKEPCVRLFNPHFGRYGELKWRESKLKSGGKDNGNIRRKRKPVEVISWAWIERGLVRATGVEDKIRLTDHSITQYKSVRKMDLGCGSLLILSWTATFTHVLSVHLFYLPFDANLI